MNLVMNCFEFTKQKRFFVFFAYRMYGLIIENLSEYIRHEYGNDKWEEIRHAARIDQPAFSTHQVYSETIVPKIAKKASQVINKPLAPIVRNNEVMEIY